MFYFNIMQENYSVLGKLKTLCVTKHGIYI